MNYRIEATVDADGKLVLEGLPFQPGESLEILIRSQNESLKNQDSLNGSVLKYERPFDPVAELDWEVDQ